MIEKIGKIILDTSGFDSFVELCQIKSVSIGDIEKMLSTNSYAKTISLMGANWDCLMINNG